MKNYIGIGCVPPNWLYTDGKRLNLNAIGTGKGGWLTFDFKPPEIKLVNKSDS